MGEVVDDCSRVGHILLSTLAKLLVPLERSTVAMGLGTTMFALNPSSRTIVQKDLFSDN